MLPWFRELLRIIQKLPICAYYMVTRGKQKEKEERVEGREKQIDGDEEQEAKETNTEEIGGEEMEYVGARPIRMRKLSFLDRMISS